MLVQLKIKRFIIIYKNKGFCCVLFVKLLLDKGRLL